MNIEVETPVYNEKRYGKPWIAKVSLVDGKLSYSFGNWIGNAGHAGLLAIDAEEGDFIAIGQKDHRNPKHTENDIYLVNAEGKIHESDKVTAYKALIGKQ